MNFIDKVIKDYKGLPTLYFKYKRWLDEAENKLTIINKERQDLLHIMDLGSLDAINLTKIAIQLRDVQRQRREVKDVIRVLKFVMKCDTLLENNDLEGIVVKLLELKREMEERQYFIRVRDDLEHLIKD